MNIDEALIERIIREVVSQVVAEKAAGGGQNRSASGNNQNSMQSVNLGQIEQLVKNVASGDRQTSSGGQTSNAGGYHPEEPVHDVDIEEDITSREVKKRPLIDQPQDPEALERMMRLTTARIGYSCYIYSDSARYYPCRFGNFKFHVCCIIPGNNESFE